jgi:hypothetical protein
MPKRRVLAFGEYGGVASTICNNLIADLLFLRRCRAPAQSLLRLPWAQVLGLCPGLPQFQARERGRVPCSHHIWSLAACGTTAWHSGAPGVLRRGVGAPLGGLSFKARPKNKFEGNAITFLMPRTALRGLFAILTTHSTPRRIFFWFLVPWAEGLLKPFETRSYG